MKDRLELHRRILRWDEATIEQIRQFDSGKYASLSEEDISWQKACHDLQGVPLLLCTNDHEVYFFDTSKGKSAFATFEIGGATYEGMLEIGISDKGVIYHLMFNDQVKHKPEQLLQMIEPTLENVLEDSAESGQWCNKDGYEIAKKGDTYVVTMDMSTDPTRSTNPSCRKLTIYPNKLSTKFINQS